MKILYYDCFSGISGDMNLGALLDLGVDPVFLTTQLDLLGLEGYELKISRDKRKGISGTRVDVNMIPVESESDSHEHSHPDHPHHRNLKDISGIIDNSKLDGRVKARSLKMFEKLAEAEAKIHGKKVDEVHFHEVGAIDSIVDIVGAAICIEYLKPDLILASPVQLGGGFVECDHGIFPVPAPATAEILTGIPVRTGAVEFETTTPTGALILACNVNEFKSMDGLRIQAVAYGIGHKELEIPNVLRVYQASEADLNTTDNTKAWILECNIDDMNPEVYGYVMDRLFALGADDVFITPIIMKKARPATKLSVLCSAEKKEEITDAVLRHTTSLGLRSYEVDKTMLKREFSKINTRFGDITIKTAVYKGEKLKSKPEYDDCVRVAEKHGIPVQQVYQEIWGLINKED